MPHFVGLDLLVSHYRISSCIKGPHCVGQLLNSGFYVVHDIVG